MIKNGMTTMTRSQLVTLSRNCACLSLLGHRHAVVDDRISSVKAFTRKR